MSPDTGEEAGEQGLTQTVIRRFHDHLLSEGKSQQQVPLDFSPAGFTEAGRISKLVRLCKCSSRFSLQEEH